MERNMDQIAIENWKMTEKEFETIRKCIQLMQTEWDAFGPERFGPFLLLNWIRQMKNSLKTIDVIWRSYCLEKAFSLPEIKASLHLSCSSEPDNTMFPPN